MTRALYVIGGAGVGKSYLMQQVLDNLKVKDIGPFEQFHEKRSSVGNRVRLRGHSLELYGMRGPDHAPSWAGVYLGKLGGTHPGTDQLERVSSITATEWTGLGLMPPVVLGEGNTLATRPFLNALAANSQLLVLHLVAEPWVVDLRCLQRGTAQPEVFLKNTRTRAANLARDLRKGGACLVQDVDTEVPTAVDLAVGDAVRHLRQ